MKLDNLSKILTATGTINYLAAALYSLNEGVKQVSDKDGIHKEGIQERERVLDLVVKDLSAVMELLGDTLSYQDAVCPVDEYLTTPAFEVLVHGNDDTEGDFPNLEINQDA